MKSLDKVRDNKGNEVKLGSWLLYDEGPGFSKGIHKVIFNNNEYYGFDMIMFDKKWINCVGVTKPIPLEYYGVNYGYGEDEILVLKDAEVIELPEDFMDIWSQEIMDKLFSK